MSSVNMVRAAYNSQAYKFNGFIQNGLFGSDNLAAAHTDPKETICEAIRGFGRSQIAEQLFARPVADDRYVRARPGVLLLYMCSLKSLHMFTLWIGKLDCRAGVT